jgi:hypothetical protein
MAITLNQHRRGITQTLIATFSDDEAPKQGLQSLFPTVTTNTKYVSIEVERNLQLVAVDVQRCTDPNRNEFTHSLEKIFQPPYYNEMFDFTACQRYDETFAQGQAPTRIDARMLLNDASDKIRKIKNMILRAIELQRSQVVQTGIVRLKNGDNIDYKRQALSMPVLTGANTWDNINSNPLADLDRGAAFLRGEGLSGAHTINVIMGSGSFNDFMKHPQVKEQAEWTKINRMQINMPQFDNVTGMAFQGQIAGMDYIYNIWTYNETYKDPIDGVTKSYIDPYNVVMAANDFKGKTAFAGVPAILGDNVSGQYVAPVEGEFYIRDVIDQVKMAWNFIISSAPLAVPVSIDRLYTIKTGPLL